MNAQTMGAGLPDRFVELKKQIAASYPDFEARAVASWNDIIEELDKITAEIQARGSLVRVSSICRPGGARGSGAHFSCPRSQSRKSGSVNSVTLMMQRLSEFVRLEALCFMM